MKFYFALQYKRLYRYIKEAGMNPYLAFALMAIIFVLISIRLFQTVQYAAYIYPALAIGAVNFLGGVKRNDFLKSCFSPTDYKKIRLLENLIIVTPFVIFLLYKQAFLSALIVYPIAGLFSLFNKVSQFNFAIPTPFSKRPFEFPVGFRKTYGLFIIAYILTGVSAFVGNFNLGIFNLLIVFLCYLNYYSKPEPLFYVWVHAATPTGFLNQKLMTAFMYSLMLSLPIVIVLMVAFPQNAYIVLICELIGLLFLMASVLGKYAYYPSEVNIPYIFSMGFCILFPPLLLFFIPYFYNRARKTLTPILK